ncbi:hypothetical protein BC828DRAFT_400690 [Blastocladiella britannica]|nr:hypothetical protein BC828DRAFT_400690 [Blastocladiella britannica]
MDGDDCMDVDAADSLGNVAGDMSTGLVQSKVLKKSFIRSDFTKAGQSISATTTTTATTTLPTPTSTPSPSDTGATAIATANLDQECTRHVVVTMVDDACKGSLSFAKWGDFARKCDIKALCPTITTMLAKFELNELQHMAFVMFAVPLLDIFAGGKTTASLDNTSDLCNIVYCRGLCSDWTWRHRQVAYCVLLSTVDDRLWIVHGKSDVPFGGALVLLASGFLQLPPVTGTPLFSTTIPSASSAAIAHGHMIFKGICQCISLVESMCFCSSLDWGAMLADTWVGNWTNAIRKMLRRCLAAMIEDKVCRLLCLLSCPVPVFITPSNALCHSINNMSISLKCNRKVFYLPVSLTEQPIEPVLVGKDIEEVGGSDDMMDINSDLSLSEEEDEVVCHLSLSGGKYEGFDVALTAEQVVPVGVLLPPHQHLQRHK